MKIDKIVLKSPDYLIQKIKENEKINPVQTHLREDNLEKSSIKKGNVTNVINLYEGVTYSQPKTVDNAPVRVLKVDPEKVIIDAGFVSGNKKMSTDELKRTNGLIAAVNGTFFALGSITIGDLKGNGKVSEDKNYDSNLDAISDKRYFIATNKEGKVITGQGGLDKLTESNIVGFIGGLGKLFDEKTVSSLERDVKNGNFYKKINGEVKTKEFPNVDLRSTISRTFAGITPDNKIIIMTVGEGKLRSNGVDVAEGALLLKSLGATSGFLLDGGGSTCMIIPGVLETKTDGRIVTSYLQVRKK